MGGTPPTSAGERLPALDLARGVAVLLLLPVTLPWFARPFHLWDAHPLPYPGWPWDRVATALTLALADHKGLTLFALVFGMATGLQLRRPGGEGKPFLRRFLWRMFLLLLLGAAHAALLWWGDLLMACAVVGMHVIVIANMSANMERLSLAVGLVWFHLAILTLTFFAVVPP